MKKTVFILALSLVSLAPRTSAFTKPILRHVEGLHGIEANAGITAIGKSCAIDWSYYFTPCWQIKAGIGAEIDKFQIAVFFTYYKTFLMTFDYMIDSICFFKPEVMQQTASHTEKVAREEGKLIKWLIKIISYGGNLFLFTQQGVTYFMHYIKSVSLLILSILGPLAALFSLLPAPFNASFKTWSKGYINVSCWSITLAILEVLANAFQATTGYEGYRVMLSFALFIMTFFVPTWTARLIGNVNLGHVAAGIGTGVGKTYTGVGQAYKVAFGQKKDGK